MHRSRLCLTKKWLSIGVFFVFTMAEGGFYPYVHAVSDQYETIKACVISREMDLTDAVRSKYADCLGWKADKSSSICFGRYTPILVNPLANAEEIRVKADHASFYDNQKSTLSGHVEVQQGLRIVNAQTAYIYRDNKTHQVNKIELLGEVYYLEPDRLIIAEKVTINPKDKSGESINVLYRFNSNKNQAQLPAWGRASLIQRFANKDLLLRQATYTTCAPQDKAWSLEAQSIRIDDAKATGVAKNATLRVHDWPVLYTPYLNFPTTKERKSGFLMPLVGYSNVGGVDFGLPYYLNLAPNYDMTLTPHIYSRRGVMMGGEFRYLLPRSIGAFNGNYLPHDKAYSQFLQNNELEFPKLQGNSTDRWIAGLVNTSSLAPNLKFRANFQQVSDDYYFQDFSTNLALITQTQLLRQADLTYTTDHWILSGLVQSYQTLHPINEPPVISPYQRLPELTARGYYFDLPYNLQLALQGQYDQFEAPSDPNFPRYRPQGPRLHANPNLTWPFTKSWGYFTPSVQVVENYYEVQSKEAFTHSNFNRTIPRYSVDSGLYFDREIHFARHALTQTLEPRLFYLNVPFENQTPIPVYDSGNMIFNVDQLFRTNRFSGFDRIGDANQLAYGLTSRFLSEESGAEIANMTVGQIKYFADRRVKLCYSSTGFCLDNPLTLGYLSPTYDFSPVASRGVYHLNSRWALSGDYIWDPATHATNNGDLNLHYQYAPSALISGGYSYLINGDLTPARYNQGHNDALHQFILAYAWPLKNKWSTIGAYSHNISKNYSMMSLFGVQYDSCCWAMRILGGRTFKSLDRYYEPQYNNNVYIQILLKGLGTVANSDPYNVLSTYIPGYNDPFHR